MLFSFYSHLYSLRDAGLKLASWFGLEMNRIRETSETASQPYQKNESSTIRPAEVGDRDTRFGIYDPLAEWIELRAANHSLSSFEKSAYIAVLGQIEELAKAEMRGAT